MAKLSPLMAAPPLIFAGLLIMFAVGNARKGDREALPSVFVGQPAPSVQSEPLLGRRALTNSDLRDGQLTVVNFWASWCPPCRAEHPTLKALDAEGLRVVGVNFKDKASQANKYLDSDGDPFFAIAYDPKGRIAIDWGVTAPPETFIVDGSGTVLFKFIGPLVGSDYEQRFRPAIEAAKAASQD